MQAGIVPVLIVLFLAIALAISADTAQAQNIQIKSQHVGDTVSYSGHTLPGAGVTIAVTSSTTTPVSVGTYEMQLGPINVPACNVVITVSNVQTINFGGSMYIEVLGIGGWTPEITKSVGLSTASAGAYSYSVGGGQYKVRVFGDAAPGASNVNIDVSVSQQVTADGVGDYSMSVSTAGLPAGVYTVTANGVVVQRVYLDVSAPQTYTLELSRGWNIFSLPIIPEDSNIASIFTSDQLNNVNVIWDYNGGNWLYFTRKAGYASQFSSLDMNKGYYIYCKTPMSVQVIGSAGPGVIPYSSLKKGWNLIGYPTTSSTAISSVYGSAYVIWKIDNGNWYYYTTRPGLVGQFDTLTPGHGYWINKKQ